MPSPAIIESEGKPTVTGIPHHWYAIQARSNFECQIAAELDAKGIEHYLPSYDEVHQWKDRKKRVCGVVPCKALKAF
jgi:hypothetical protein